MGAFRDFLDSLSWAKHAGGIGAPPTGGETGPPLIASEPESQTYTIPEIESIASSPEAQAAIRPLAPPRTPVDQPEVEAHLATTGHVPESDYMARQFYQESRGSTRVSQEDPSGNNYIGLSGMGAGSLQDQELLLRKSGADDFEGTFTKRAVRVGIEARVVRDEEGNYIGADNETNQQAFKNAPYESQALVAFEFARGQLEEIRTDPELKELADRVRERQLVDKDGEPLSYKGDDDLRITDATMMRIGAHAGIDGLKEVLRNAEEHPDGGISFGKDIKDVAAQTSTTQSAIPFTNLDIPMDDPLRSDKSIYEMNKAELREVAESLDIAPEKLEKMGIYRNAPDGPEQEYSRSREGFGR